MIVIGLATAVINVTYQSYAPRALVEGSDIFSILLRWHYGLNRPLTAFPSLHVSDSVCVSYYLGRVRVQQVWLWLTCAFLISISTLLVKEHYIADVIGGLVLGVVVSTLLPRLLSGRQRVRIGSIQ